jgi:hypothetical protein
MTRIFLLIYILILAGVTAYSQDTRIGKISQEELEEIKHPKDTSASAAVLYRQVSVKYRYVENSGFQLVTNVRERVKIYNKDGFEYATVNKRLYRDDSDYVSMSGVKALTYNLENGAIKKIKMKGSEVFQKSLNKYYDEWSFTLPDVREGSVIEYQYSINSPFSYSIDEIELQYDIPIKKQLITVVIPEYFKFKHRLKGYLSATPKYEKRQGKINYTSKNSEDNGYSRNTTYSNNSLDYFQNATIFSMSEVPALREEPFVNDMDNYRSAINFELLYVDFPNTDRKDYSTSWDKVIKTIYASNRFGDQLNATRYFKDDLTVLISEDNTEVEKIALIYQYVQKRMTWNGIWGYYVDNGVKKAYAEKSGNTADINLILVAMLREAGVNANPILISTRDNGVPLFPTRNGFNYVAAAAEINGSTILLDATNKFAVPNLLPTQALNWFGRVIEKKGDIKTVSITPSTLSKEMTMINVEMDSEGAINGQMRRTCTNYNAYIFRNEFASVDEESYLERFESENNGIEISQYEISNKLNLAKPIIENFKFIAENQADIIGDEIYLSPLFHYTTRENPFKLEQRNYPIDFTFPQEEKYIVTIKIPEGYKTSSIPDPMRIALENKVASFIYQIVDKGTSLQVMADLKINEAVIAPQHYAALKELFNKIVEKETEKVVLSKISGNEHQENTTGGR